GTDTLALRAESDERALASRECDVDVVGRVKPNPDVGEDEVVLFLVLLHLNLAVEARDPSPVVEIAHTERDLVKANVFPVSELLADERDVPLIGGGSDPGKAHRVRRRPVAF